MLQSKPKLSLEAAEVATAFSRLSSSRSSNGYGPNPISLSEVNAYLQLFGGAWCDIETFIQLIWRTDRIFMRMMAEKSKKATARGGRKT